MDREGGGGEWIGKGGGKGGVCDNLEGSLLSQWQEVIHEEAGGVKGGGGLVGLGGDAPGPEGCWEHWKEVKYPGGEGEI